jgi:hypothetical protein
LGWFQRDRGRGQRGALRFQPQLGAADKLLHIAAARDVGASRGLETGKAAEHGDGDHTRDDHRHHAQNADAIDECADDAAGHPDREHRNQDIAQPLRQVRFLDPRRSFADRGRTAMPSAFAIVAQERPAFAQQAIAVAGEVGHARYSAVSRFDSLTWREA